MYAPPMDTGSTPNVLSRRMRTASPGIVTLAIIRMVALVIRASPSTCCDALQPVIHAGGRACAITVTTAVATAATPKNAVLRKSVLGVTGGSPRPTHAPGFERHSGHS